MKTDRNSRTCHHRNEIVGVRNLSRVIENRNDQETDEAARKSRPMISAATMSGRRGHLCESVRCPLQRGQVAI